MAPAQLALKVLSLNSARYRMSRSDETQIEVEALGAKLKATPSEIIRTVSQVGSFIALIALGIYALAIEKPATMQWITEHDRRHTEQVERMQAKFDDSMRNVVDKHATALERLTDKLDRLWERRSTAAVPVAP